MALTRRSLALLHELRVEIGEIADTASARIGRAWTSAWRQAAPAWRSATAALVDAQQGGAQLGAWQVARIPEVAAAIRQTRAETVTAAAVSTRHATAATEAAITATLKAEPAVIAAQLRRAATADFARGITQARADALTQAARRQAVAAVQPLGADIADGVERVVTRPPVGANTLRLGAHIEAAFQQGPVRATATTQTHTLDAYRAAAGYVAEVNADAVAGWMWHADAGPRCCPACWSMHGTMHPLRETGPLGHVSCRCARISIARDPGGAIRPPDAYSLFQRMTRTDQVTVMGPTRLRLLDDGGITFADLATRRDNTGWRPSYVPTPVADLLRQAGHRQD